MKRHLLGSSLIAGLLALTACGDDGDGTPMTDAGNTGDGGITADMATTADASEGDMAITGDASLLDMTIEPDAAVTTPIPFAELPGEFASIMCAKRECILSGPGSSDLSILGQIFLGGADITECTERATTFLEQLALAPAIEAVTNGAATYDAAAARTCLNSLREAEGCDLFEASCFETLITGATEEGEPCKFYDGDDYCEAGTECTGDNVGAICGDGVCVARAGLGEACTQDGDCLAPPERANAYGWSRCQTNGPGPAASMECTHYYTIRTAEAGASCNAPHTAESTNVYTTADCVDGAYCNDGTCAAEVYAALNEACEGASDDELECEPGLVCVGVCKPLTFVSTVGADCGDIGTSVALCDPAAGVVCQVDFDTFEGTCLAIGDGTTGSVCAMGIGQVLGTSACDSTSYCPDFTDGVPVAAECVAKKANGARCEDSIECSSGACISNAGDRECGDPICVI